MLSYRSLWEDLVEILFKSFSRGPCSKVLKIFCVGACLKVFLGCSQEVGGVRASHPRHSPQISESRTS